MSKTTPTVLTQDEVDDFNALWRLARHLRDIQENLVDELSHITGESGDDGDMSQTVAWDVVHNNDDLHDVLRRRNLALPASPQG